VLAADQKKEAFLRYSGTKNGFLGQVATYVEKNDGVHLPLSEHTTSAACYIQPL
jgi:hypothetical protein